MTQRRVIALMALVAGLVPVYLYLVKIGVAGTLMCGGGPHGCEYIQSSAYGQLFGVDVSLLGAVFYAAIFVVAMAGSLERLADDKRPTMALMALIYPGFAFTLWLKYAEFVILKGFCRWCVVSAVAITLSTILVTLDWQRQKILSLRTRSST